MSERPHSTAAVAGGRYAPTRWLGGSSRDRPNGINTAIGIDEAGINDDHDMLQEMRMVLRAHRVPGMDDEAPTPAQVFRMATSGGAKTTAFGDTIGALQAGRAADMVLIDWRDISYPYLDTETPLLDAVLQRAKTSGVRSVICDGEVIYHDGKFAKVDRDGALRALHEDLQRALSDDEVERRRLPRHCCRMCGDFTPITSMPSSMSPFIDPVPGGSGTAPRRAKMAAPVALDSCYTKRNMR